MGSRKLPSPWRGSAGHQSPQNQFSLVPALYPRWLGPPPSPLGPFCGTSWLVISCIQQEGVLLMRSVVFPLKKHCAIRLCVPLLWDVTGKEEESRGETRASSAHLKGFVFPCSPSIICASSLLYSLPSEEGPPHPHVQSYKNTSQVTTPAQALSAFPSFLGSSIASSVLKLDPKLRPHLRCHLPSQSGAFVKHLLATEYQLRSHSLHGESVNNHAETVLSACLDRIQRKV